MALPRLRWRLQVDTHDRVVTLRERSVVREASAVVSQLTKTHELVRWTPSRVEVCVDGIVLDPNARITQDGYVWQPARMGEHTLMVALPLDDSGKPFCYLDGSLIEAERLPDAPEVPVMPGGQPGQARWSALSARAGHASVLTTAAALPLPVRPRRTSIERLVAVGRWRSRLYTLMLFVLIGALTVGLGELITLPGAVVLVGLFVLAATVIQFIGTLRSAAAPLAQFLLKGHQPVRATPAIAPSFCSVMFRLCAEMRIDTPDLYVVDAPVLNALAGGRSPRHGTVVVTTKLLAVLTEAELEAVLRHELAHLRNSDSVAKSIGLIVATALLQIRALLVLFAQPKSPPKDAFERVYHVIFALVNGVLGLFTGLAEAIAYAVRREREAMADATAALTPEGARNLASALLRIHGESAAAPAGTPALAMGGAAPTPPAWPLAAAAHTSCFTGDAAATSFVARALRAEHPSMEWRVRRLEDLADALDAQRRA